MHGKRAKIKSDKQRDYGSYGSRSTKPGSDKWYKRLWNRKDRRAAKRDPEK